MMKQSIMSLLIISIITTAQAAQTNEPDPLLKLTEAAVAQGQDISGWEVVIRETIDPSEFNQSEFERNKEMIKIEDEKSSKYTYDRQKGTGITVYYTVVVPKQGNGPIERIAAIKGDRWTDEMKEEYLTVQSELLRESFTADYRLFTCIEFIDNGTIDDGHLVGYLASALEFTLKNTQDDVLEGTTIKKIYYGYTPLWTNYFIIKDEPINLQVAVSKKEHGELHYMIGTPILVTEY